MLNFNRIRCEFPQPYSKLSDDEIRKIFAEQMQDCNGGYAFQICKKCGAYWTGPHFNTRTAKIVDKCEECFDVNEKETILN